MNEGLDFVRGIGQKYFVTAFCFLLFTIVLGIFWQVGYPEEEGLSFLAAASLACTLVTIEIAFTLFHLNQLATVIKADLNQYTTVIKADQKGWAEKTMGVFRFELLKVQEVMVSTQKMHFNLLWNAIQEKDPPSFQSPS